MKKYAPLEDYLFELSKSKKQEWNTNFKFIEAIIGSNLPPSAFNHKEWWANENEKTTKVQCHAWRRAGWKTTAVNLISGTVTFINLPNHFEIKSDISEDKNISISYRWSSIGYVAIDHKGRLIFPPIDAQAGIYKIEINASQGLFEYIGETDNFKRRFQHYRTPGAKQSTNIRINHLIKETISDSGRTNIYIMQGMKLLNSVISSEELNIKNTRKLFEAAAIEISKNNKFMSLNL